MKRTPLNRRTPLKQGGSLKRTALKRCPCTLDRSHMPKINKVRAAKRRARDFGPHGDYIIPTLPCPVACKAWWDRVDDETLVGMMERAMDEPKRFAHVSEPAHATHSRGAGGQSSALVPLSSALHSEKHTIGVASFAAKYGTDLPELAARLWRLSPAHTLEES